MKRKAGVEPSRLRWTDAVSEAIAAVTDRPIRTLLTALGTIVGVGAFVTTTGLAETARAQVSSRFDALRATEVTIEDAIPDGSNPFPADVEARLGRLNGVNHAGLYFTVPDNGRLQPRSQPARPLGSASSPISVIAADPGAIDAAIPTLASGRTFDSFHQDRAERVALLGRVVADRLHITRVDNQPAVFVNDIPYTVIGIIEDVKRNHDFLLSVVIPTNAATSDFSISGATYKVLIDTEPGAASLVGRQAPIALRPDNPQRLQAYIPPDVKTLRNQVSEDVTTLFLALSGLALIIGMIAIANATLLNIIERRPEIGLRRALGATRTHITCQIGIEAAMTGVVGGLTGAALAMASVAVISMEKGWTVTVNPAVIAVAPAIGLMTGALAGLMPAARAARTPPATTLRGQ